MMFNGWGMGDAGGFWVVGGLLLLVGCVVLVVWAVSTISGRDHVSSPSSQGVPPLDILRERFARGEISEQEFEQAKKTLGL
jgi:putative membrane protein